MRKLNIGRILFCIGMFSIASGLLAGCAGLQKAYPEKQFIMIEAQRDAVNPSPLQGNILEIKKMDSDMPYSSKEIIHRKTTHQFESDFYTNYFIRPDVMLTQQCKSWLAGSGMFREVIERGGGLSPTHLLQSRLTALYVDDQDASNRKAVIEIWFMLLDESGQGQMFCLARNTGKRWR